MRSATSVKKISERLAIAFIALAFVLSASGGARALSLSGSVSNAGNYTIAQLQGLTSTTEMIGADTYVGVSLWGFLGGMANGNSNIITSGGGNNPILRNYVLATGSDGSKSLISAGEINPLFGGTGANSYLIAYEKNGSVLSVPLLIVTDDPTGTRNITQLTDLTVSGVSRPPVGPGGLSTQFTLTGVSQPDTYDLNDLNAIAPTTFNNVIFFQGATQVGPHNYTGVDLWNFLLNSGFDMSQLLTTYLLSTGTDGFQVLYALAELNPAFGAAQNLIAYSCDPSPSAATGSCPGDGTIGTAGFARMVIPGDFRGGRYVSNVGSLKVASVPEPNSLVLLFSGLLLLVRRKFRHSVY